MLLSFIKGEPDSSKFACFSNFHEGRRGSNESRKRKERYPDQSEGARREDCRSPWYFVKRDELGTSQQAGEKKASKSPAATGRFQ